MCTSYRRIETAAPEHHHVAQSSPWKRKRGRRKRKRKRTHNRRQTSRDPAVVVQSVRTREYRHNAHFNHSTAWELALRWRNKAYKQVIEHTPSFKTASYELFFMWLQFVWRVATVMIDPASRMRFGSIALFGIASDRWHSLRPRRRSYLDGTRAWSSLSGTGFQDRLHDHPKALVKGFRKALRARATALLVDEFPTSHQCSCCFEQLEQFSVRQKRTGQVTTFRQILRFSTSVCRTIRKRDECSQEHLPTRVMCYHHQPRPTNVQRER